MAQWDNQLDSMLDDLHATVQNTSYQEKQIYDESKPGQKFSKQSYEFSSVSKHQGDGDIRGGQLVGNLPKSLVSDLSSIEKVKSVNHTSVTSSERYEYSTSSSIQKSSTHGLQSSNHSLQSSNHGIHSSSHGLQSSNHGLQSSNYGLQSSTNTQQSIKKNINDLDHLLNNLSSHNSSRDASPATRHRIESSYQSNLSSGICQKSEEIREKLISNNSLSRTSSFNRGDPRKPVSTGSRPITPGLPHDQVEGSHQPHLLHTTHSTTASRTQFSGSRSNVSNEFHPVHTTPDPLTGRYADGRITPNHGYTRNFSDKIKSETDSNGNIPKRPDELLNSFGANIDQRELEKINQNETATMEKLMAASYKKNIGQDEDHVEYKKGPPVFYPTEEMYETRQTGMYAGESAKMAKMSKSKVDSDEKGGAAVIPICLPLCCAAPCVIL
ncbi:uncharacterized protein LOC111713434 [Eurytemora carolleeae]|uniref:uncharacterized protein LOC111713434 n=1 Tax=Eurytemora carolleeae TaxID=1294199 RepID=UPI000C76395C|nr:uncharacterized protein LOC111713434 [Eurytemora carolleeae]|eukprot:XP_023344056.1 uncharacterized protein LOC111713434 [Eurytemora affinis]